MDVQKKIVFYSLVFLCSLDCSLDAKERAPEFTHQKASEWINSPPLRLTSLKDKVVLLDVWTFDCWNCYRSFPWLKTIEKKFSKKLQVIGVHAPEFDHERVIRNVRRKVELFGLTHPVVIDNDFSYWRALNNRYWPTFYLIDKNGYIRESFVGETHVGTQKARNIESSIQKLLTE